MSTTKTVEEAVGNTVKFLERHPCERSDKVLGNKNTHMYYPRLVCSGVVMTSWNAPWLLLLDTITMQVSPRNS